MPHSNRVDQLLSSMTLEQKIGQMLALGFSGTYPHPDILRMIEKYHVAGFRVTPTGRKFVRDLRPGSPDEKRVMRPLEPNERAYAASIAARLFPRRDDRQ